MSASEISRGDAWNATALVFSEHATSDDHAVPFDQWLVITRGCGQVGLNDAQSAVVAGDWVQIPAYAFHRYWTEDSGMEAIVLAFELKAGAELVRLPDPAGLARNAAIRFVRLAARVISERGRFAVALSGGSTPRAMYALLATPEFAAQVDWTHVHFFWGDERAVPPEDDSSNFRMAHDTLLSSLSIPEQNIHRMRGEIELQRAASEYAQDLREFFSNPEPLVAAGKETAAVAMPRFDLVLLGLGANGHTASLFPHSALLQGTADWVAAEYVPEVKMNRITLTAPVINSAHNILFLVAGSDKAATARAVIRGEYHPQDLPAQLIRPHDGQLTWLLDRDAAAQLAHA